MSKKIASGLHKKRKDISPEELASLVNQLRVMVHERCSPIPDEPEYSTSEQTYVICTIMAYQLRNFHGVESNLESSKDICLAHLN